MKLKKGHKAPDFTLPSTRGGDFTLSENLDQTLVLYFYPKDFTGGCTAEACSFRDEIEDFKDLDIRVVGISTDSIKTHHRFKEKYGLPFDLLADTDGRVTRLYDAMVPFLNIGKRITFLINTEGVIIDMYSNALMAKKHISEIKKSGQALKAEMSKTS